MSRSLDEHTCFSSVLLLIWSKLNSYARSIHETVFNVKQSIYESLSKLHFGRLRFHINM